MEHPLTQVSLCTGMGALDLAVEQVLGARLRVAAEIEPAALAVLKVRFPEAELLGSISSAVWGSVDSPGVLTMGLPCQAVSSARGGKATAMSPDWLWPQGRRAVAELEPETVFFENVKNLLAVDDGRAWEQVVQDLLGLGYAVRWLTIGACAVGAPHHRHRVFLLGTRSSNPTAVRVPVAECGDMLPDGLALLPTPMAKEGSRRGVGTASFWAARQRAERRGKESPPLSAMVGSLADGQRPGEAFWFDEFEPAIRRWESRMGPAPYPLIQWGGLRLAPNFCEWMLGLERGWTSPAAQVRERLTMLGNGVCVPQAVRALELLVEREAPAGVLPAELQLPQRVLSAKELSSGVMHATRLPAAASERFRAEAARRGLRSAQLQREVLLAFLESL